MLIKLNVYETEPNIENQLLATRIYLVLLMISIIIVSTFVGLTQQAHTVTIQSPNESQFNSLHIQYPHSLSCPCTNIGIMYSTFVEISPVTHSLCSTSFYSVDAWIFPISTNQTWMDLDLFLLITQFRLLSSICELVSKEIFIVLYNFVMHRFNSLETISRESFEWQSNSTTTLLIDDVVNRFRRLLVLTADTLRSNQYQNLYMSNWQTELSAVATDYILLATPISYNNGTCICAAGMSNCSRPLMFKDLNNNIITFSGENDCFFRLLMNYSKGNFLLLSKNIAYDSLTSVV